MIIPSKGHKVIQVWVCQNILYYVQNMIYYSFIKFAIPSYNCPQSIPGKWASVTAQFGIKSDSVNLVCLLSNYGKEVHTWFLFPKVEEKNSSVEYFPPYFNEYSSANLHVQYTVSQTDIRCAICPDSCCATARGIRLLHAIVQWVSLHYRFLL